jgi:PKD repeat protein
VAAFAAAPLAGQPPLTVVFTDTSTGPVTAWQWDFGDGATSTAQHPTHTYELSGTFTVSLTASGPGGYDTLVRADYVRVRTSALIANFTAYPTSGPLPLSVQFADASAGPVTAWHWDFGDGITSTLENPVHTYTTAGAYTVTLSVSGAGSADTLARASYIHASPSSPVAAFAAAPLAGQPPLTVIFTDTSTGPVTAWQWDFGDGATSTAQHPTHTYELSGTFTVSLTASGPGGYDTLVRADYVRVRTSALIANFTAYPTSGPLPLSVQFADASAGPVTAWHWDFGDGITSTLENPVHTYTAAGTYTVTLSVSGTGSMDTLARAHYISVQATPLVAAFEAAPLAGQAPLTVVFTDTSSGLIDTWIWTFGDGGGSTASNPTYTYTSAGVYTVTLTVIGPTGSHGVVHPALVTVIPPKQAYIYLPILLKQ